MYGYIYKTTNLITGKIYVGQHKSSTFNHNYYGSGVRITNLFKKYGKSNFICEILEECDSENELNQKEQYWIQKLDAMNRNIGYNLMSGGYKVRGIKHSKETREKISKSRKGIIPHREYPPVPEDVKKKISDTLKKYYKTHNNAKKGTHLSEETKEKLRQANLGKKYSEEVKQKHRGKPAWNKGISMSEEAKQHLREVNKGKKQNLSKEVRNDKRIRMLGENNPNYGGLKESTKKKISRAIKGRIWITNGIVNKQIHPQELENVYKTQGFYRGRTLH